MWRTLLWFILKLAIASLALYAFWEWRGQAAYALLFRWLAPPIYRLVGIELASLRGAVDVVGERFYNLLPFLSLMAAMWGIGWKRRLWGTVAGLAVIIAWHVTFPVIVRAIISAHRLDPTAYIELSPWFLFSDSLPLLLWIVISHRPLFAALKLTRKELPLG